MVRMLKRLITRSATMGKTLPGLSLALFSGLASATDYADDYIKTTNSDKIASPGEGWDKLWGEVIFDITIIGVVFALFIVYLLIRYRRRDPDDVGAQPKLSAVAAVGWTVIPIFVFMADDFYLAAKGWSLWNDYRDVPAERFEVKLESGMYSWNYTYPNGVETINELRVAAGTPVLLRMTSRDVIHSHYIPDFRVMEDSMPGRVTYLWFNPKEAGEHLVTCREYCGIMHSYMVGKITVMEPAAFQAWYQQEEGKLAAAKANIDNQGEA